MHQINRSLLYDERPAAETAVFVAADGYAKVTDVDDARGDVVTEHFACWRLDQRGGVGETALHLCMLYSKLPEFRAISEALLSIFPKLSVDYYEGDEYYGKFSADHSLAASADADAAKVHFTF